MSDIPHAPANMDTNAELNEHRQSFFTFERLVLFAVLHIALTLACVALAFIGHASIIALIFWVGGTLTLLSALALTGNWSQPR